MTQTFRVFATLAVLCLSLPSVAEAQGAMAADALTGLARVRRDSGDQVAARKYFEEAARLRPLSARERAEYLWVLVDLDPAAAVAVGREVLRASASDDNIRERVIVAAAAVSDEDTVRRLAEEGQRLMSKDPRWPRRLAESALRQADYAGATAAYEVAVRLGADVHDRAGLALAREATGDAAASLAAWQTVSATERGADAAWQTSYLRSLARVSPPETAATELQAWIDVHPDDEPMRALLVDAWSRAEEPGRALEALGPLTTGPDADIWRRRQVDLATAAGDRTAAIRTLEELRATHRATRADTVRLVDLLLSTERVDRAAELFTPIVDGASSCDVALLRLADRFPEPSATDMMTRLTQRVATACGADVRLTRRTIDRLVAASRHAEALAMIELLPAPTGALPQMAGLRGQLLLWTGRAPEAIDVLAPLLDRVPSDDAAREALMDAYRADHRPAEAWRVGAPLVAVSFTRPARLAVLADVALDADVPLTTIKLLDTLPADIAGQPGSRALRGRALLALGRPVEARRMLVAIDPARLNAAATAALAQATDSTDGHDGHVGGVYPRAVPAIVRTAESEWRAHPTEAAVVKMQELADRLPANQDVAVIVARALSSSGRHQDAIARLRRTAPVDLMSLDSRVALAESLEAVDQGAEALTLLEPFTDLSGDAGIMRARLMAKAVGWPRANDAFRTLAAQRDATSAVWLAWSATTPSSDQRTRLLDDAAVRFVDNVEVWSRLAAARFALGDPAGARVAAEQAIALNPGDGAAWFTLVDATATDARAQLDVILQRFDDVAEPALRIGMAQRIAGLARGPHDPLLARALEWLGGGEPGKGERDARDLARARVLAAGKRWFEATSVIDRVIDRSPEDRDALRLRAEVLSWSGRHADAIAAYDAYLEQVPLDIEAGRQQARVAGWAGAFADSRRRYASLVARAPSNPAIAAEAAAKIAFFEGHWRDAVIHYRAWLNIEPDNTEAQFELAESTRALGDFQGATDLLVRLEARPEGHLVAAEARHRADLNARPSVRLFTDDHSAAGYGGRRLLTTREQGATFDAAWGANRATALSLDSARVELSAPGERVFGYRASLAMVERLSRAVDLDASVSISDFQVAGSPLVGAARVTWRMSDRWAMAGSAERQLVVENLTNVRQGLFASGVVARLAFQSPATSLDVRTARQTLSDGNSRTRTTISFTRALAERASGLRAIVWVEQLGTRRSSEGYFSPSSFVHVDGGLEYRQSLSRARFSGDRERSVTAGYLLGIDTRHSEYRQPFARVSWELVRGLSMDARFGRIESPDYRETSLRVGLRLGGSTPALFTNR